MMKEFWRRVFPDSAEKKLAWMWLVLALIFGIYFGGWIAVAGVGIFVAVGATWWSLMVLSDD